jgi:hypothetical protein
MKYFDSSTMVAHEHQVDLLREAEQIRLLKIARAAQSAQDNRNVHAPPGHIGSPSFSSIIPWLISAISSVRWAPRHTRSS